MILIGGGGHAKSLAEFCHERIEGYLAKEKNPEMTGEWLGDDSVGPELAGKGYKFHMAFIYSGLPRMGKREALIKSYEDSGCGFETLIAPTAIISPNSVIGEGSAVLQGAIVNRSNIGRHCVVNSGAIVEHDCVVGDNTFIAPGVVIGGFTHIGKNCFIGLGARISNNIRISDNITVGIGAIVTKDLTEPGIYHGCPLHYYKCH